MIACPGEVPGGYRAPLRNGVWLLRFEPSGVQEARTAMITGIQIPRRSGWLVGLLVLFVTVPCVAKEVEELLSKLEKQRQQLRTLHLVTKTLTHGLQATGAPATKETIMETWEKRDAQVIKRRMQSTIKTAASNEGAKPAAEMRFLTVSDGQTQWTEMPLQTGRVVYKSTPSPRDEFYEIRGYLREGKGRIRHRETIHGQSCVIVDMVSEQQGKRYKATFWISEESGVVLRSALKRDDQGVWEKSTVELKINEPIDDSKFSYTPPDGTRVIDADAMKRPTRGPLTP